MVASVRSNPWPLIALVLGLVLAYDLGARTQAPALVGVASQHISVQIEVIDSSQMVFPTVPAGMTFVLRDLLLANTQANGKGSLNVGADIYPSLYAAFGASAELKIAGTNLRDWAKGNNNSDFGGGRNGKKGNTRSQTGLVGLTGGIVFEEGEMVVIRNYIGPLFFTGELIPNS
jgi:hypothetical protein